MKCGCSEGQQTVAEQHEDAVVMLFNYTKLVHQKYEYKVIVVHATLHRRYCNDISNRRSTDGDDNSEYYIWW